MPLWDRADLLTRVRDLIRRPSTDAAVTDAKLYRYLTAAESQAFEELGLTTPHALWSAPVQLTTSDGGATYTFGNDANANPLVPIRVDVFRSRGDIPDYPLIEGDDYLWEGEIIRIPQGRTRSFAGGPWARYIAPAIEITAAQGPTLTPHAARELLILGAAIRSGREGAMREVTDWERDYATALQRWRTRLGNTVGTQGRGEIGAQRPDWWTNPDMGSRGYGVGGG